MAAMQRSIRKALSAAFLFSPLACSGSSAQNGSDRGQIVDSSGGTVALGILASSYKATPFGASGNLGGHIVAANAVSDSSIVVAKDPGVCGASASLRDAHAQGESLANVLVWVDGIVAGKPLPELRRQTLTIEKCHFEPRVLAVRTGSTINIFSKDHAVHEATFYREGANEPLLRVHTVDEGQVVPSEHIANAPGIVEVRCPEHPFARGWLAVFDHPYFAVTDASGEFTIDSLPPGTYTVKIWQERLEKPVQQRVVIGAGGTGRLDLNLALK
jgi:plastocyanin